MKKTSILLVTLFFSIALFAQVPEWAKVGTSKIDTIKSTILGVERTYSVYLPYSYSQDKNKEYPVLYLLHGMNDPDQGRGLCRSAGDIVNQLVKSGEACEMIIITPDAVTDWNGYFNMKDWYFEDFFFKEFLPYVESTYRIKKDKKFRAIAGLSMGGGGATSYAQRYTNMFSACFAMSALMNIPGNDEQEIMDAKVAELTQAVKEYSTIKYIQNANDKVKDTLREIAWFIDCGDDDFLLQVNIEFFQAMKASSIPVELRVRDGGHTWEYWQSSLYIAIPFVSRAFYPFL